MDHNVIFFSMSFPFPLILSGMFGAQVEDAKRRTSLILQSRKAAVKRDSGSFGEDAWLCPTLLHHGSLLCLRKGWGKKK